MSTFDPLHLVRRFVAVVRARPLLAHEQAWVAGVLAGEGTAGAVAELFWAQAAPDQRHAHDAARWVAERAPDRTDLVTAALLHDVGKRHARLGPLGRSCATVWPRRLGPAAFAAYREHGPRGADDLESAGAPDWATQFARHHQGDRPAGADPADWALLTEADHRS